MTRNSRERSDAQPKTGDVMLGCEHGPDLRVNDVLFYPDGVPVNGVGDGVEMVHYLVFCPSCFERYQKQGLQAVSFRFKRSWKEGDGNIKLAEVND